MTTPGLGECISGAILYDETIRQKKKDGTLFTKVLVDMGIIPGIKVDSGAKDLAEHSKMGARFAKWRAVIAPGTGALGRGLLILPRAGGPTNGYCFIVPDAIALLAAAHTMPPWKRHEN